MPCAANWRSHSSRTSVAGSCPSPRPVANVLVSAITTRGLGADVLHAVLAEYQLIVGDTVLSEVRRVLRQKIRLPADAVGEVEVFLRQQTPRHLRSQVP